ncbi:MAG: Ig-like domain-containing protein [Verrucomicrobia bacterium]|nr:Ig-like domain-containing protein [Verrucomicrobiota bacterium]
MSLLLAGVSPHSSTVIAAEQDSVSRKSASVGTASFHPPELFYVIVAPTNQVTFKAPATFVFEAIRQANDGSTNPVEFFVGTNLVNLKNEPPYAVVVSNLARGTYSLRVSAMDRYGFVKDSRTVEVTVGDFNNNPPAVAITNLTYVDSGFIMPAAIAFKTLATDTDGTVERVEFFDGTNLLGEVTSPPYTFVMSNWVTRSAQHFVTARATDNLGTSVTSPEVVLNIGTTNELSIVVGYQEPASGGVFRSLAPITFAAAFRHSDNNVTPVDFYIGTNLAGSVLDPPFRVIVTNLTAGTYDLSLRITDLKGNEFRSTSSQITVVDLSLQTPQYTPPGGLRFQVKSGLPGKVHVLQLSTNLVKWLSIQTNVPNSEIFEFVDPASFGLTEAYYRVWLWP